MIKETKIGGSDFLSVPVPIDSKHHQLIMNMKTNMVHLCMVIGNIGEYKVVFSDDLPDFNYEIYCKSENLPFEVLRQLGLEFGSFLILKKI